MKNFILLLLVLCMPFLASAQGEAPTLDTSTPQSLFGSLEVLYGALVIIGGYISAFIPGLNMIPKSVFRVLAFAIILALAFVLFGFADVLPLALSYAASTSIYETILKWIKRSPAA